MNQNATIPDQTDRFSAQAMQSATPMMQQYMGIKQQHKDTLLFYRMGDFYELFFDDAVLAAKVLNISLTHRGKHLDTDIPMCGVPYHAYESYLHKLILAGHKVAICEQMESPKEAKKRGHKSVVKREVVRIITPGTVTEEALLEQQSASYLLSIAPAKTHLALAWADISTGAFHVANIAVESLEAELQRLQPKEILIKEGMAEQAEYADALRVFKRHLRAEVSSQFASAKGQRMVMQWFKVEQAEHLGEFSGAEYGAMGALLAYIERTQIQHMPYLQQPKRFSVEHAMQMDAATRMHLELNRTINGEKRGSVLHAINHTVSAAGSRLLGHRLNAPLYDQHAINARLDEVEFFLQQPGIAQKLRQYLQIIPDIARCLSRLSTGRGSPQDAGNMRMALSVSRHVAELLQFHLQEQAESLPQNIVGQLQYLAQFDVLCHKLEESLVDIPPPLLREGGIIRTGYHPKLDEYRSLSEETELHKQALRDEYAALTTVDKLKIKENNVIGMFIEVSQNHAEHLMQHPEFIHRQTMASGVRFTSEKLRALEAKLVHAKAYALELELQLFGEVVEAILAESERLSLLAFSLASLDVAASLAHLAEERHFSRPQLNETTDISITAGRHPVVERLSQVDFVANDLQLKQDVRVWLMTGPNMAGKSTFLRQNAVIILLAQMGSYVPAKSAHIGLVDKIFSRVGASDNLAKGQSTFMIEMIETAHILRHATDKSFVILDEIGRGTATYDGLSIAWAVLEMLHNQLKSRTLFATHYHEMTVLEETLTHVQNYHMHVREWEGDVVFLHEVKAGTADRSYGLHVAKLAGLPKNVLKRAADVLQILEGKEATQHSIPEAEAEPQAVAIQSSPLSDTLCRLDLDALSPREALDVLFALQEEAMSS